MSETTITKYCPKCNTTKTRKDFHKCKTRHDGLCSHCAECRAKTAKKRRQTLLAVKKKRAKDKIIKRCPSCNITKPRSEFYKSQTRSDGLESYCIPCTKIRHRKCDKSPKTRKRRAEYNQNHPEKIRKSSKKYRETWPEKIAAHKAIHEATQKGILPKARSLTCEQCDQQAEEYHHYSYAEEDWLSVIALCRICHNRLHRISYADTAPAMNM
jgi:hypothetical protein